MKLRFIPGIIFSITLALLSTDLRAQEESNEDSLTIAPDDPVVAMLDSLLYSGYCNANCFSADTGVLNVYGYAPDSVPEFSEEVLRQRLEELNRLTPMEITYNRDVHNFINLYANKKRILTSRALGLSELYFPMFEELFDRYDIPYEMRYLAVVESALNPRAKSWAGAVGIWQFMYSTGKMYDLRVSSYYDERMDPYQATEAACKYLKYLHSLYDDWNLALAAYNSGPGNVNKAIRRSGGKKDFWEIQKRLPRETQSYVPAFIAVNYVMHYASEHNLYPIPPDMSYFETDTIYITKELKFDQIEAFTDVSEETLAMLNPSFRRNVIPQDGYRHILRLPYDAVGDFIANEEEIYKYNEDEPQAVDGYITREEMIYHRVRSGDVLGVIAERYGVGLSELRSWNGIRGNMIRAGDRLVIYKETKIKVEDARSEEKEESEATTENKTSTEEKTSEKNTVQAEVDDPSQFKYHTVQQGDTLWDIANKYDGVTVNDLKRLNGAVNTKRLKLGQKIKIQKI
ncbi:lytic transglycosylase domain-containing protein [Halocola ammonii]